METPDWFIDSKSYSCSANESASVVVGGKRKNWKVIKMFFVEYEEEEEEKEEEEEYFDLLG